MLHLAFAFCFSFFFTRFQLLETIITVHALLGPTTTLFRKKILKMGLTALFTHLKIILLQCFQFSVSAKISYIQTDPKFIQLLNGIGVVSLSARMLFAGRCQFIIITFYFLLDQDKNIENKPKFTLVVSRYSLGCTK